MEQEEAVETIMKLGLTVLQAKVYLALARCGSATGRTTANAAQIASNDVYRVLGELQEKGLVEKIIANPTRYKSTRDDGLSILLQNKKNEYFETEKQVQALAELLNIQSKTETSFNSNQELIITSQIQQLIKLHKRLADSAKHSIDFIFPVRVSEKSLLENFLFEKKALNRGVNVRILLVNGKGNAERYHRKAQLFEQRYLPEETFFGMHIFDGQQITMALSKKAIPSLWTNNQNIVNLAQAYFDSIWNNAIVNAKK
jgi:Predicted transcriptional regulators